MTNGKGNIMDLELLKLWMDTIKQSAANQTLMDEFGRWMKGDAKESDELYGLFRKYYGPKQGTDAFEDYENQLKEVLENFQKSFKELLSILGVVPKSEYDQLHQQYEALKEKVAGLEEKIESLRKSFNKDAPEQAGGAGALDEIIKAQTDQFAKLMNSFTGISGAKPSKDEKK